MYVFNDGASGAMEIVKPDVSTGFMKLLMSGGGGWKRVEEAKARERALLVICLSYAIFGCNKAFVKTCQTSRLSQGD